MRSPRERVTTSAELDCHSPRGGRPGGDETSLVVDPTRRPTPSHVDETGTLERLSSEELHRLALRRAVERRDVRFLWELLELLPAAEAAAGELDEAEADVLTLRARIDDLADAG